MNVFVSFTQISVVCQEPKLFARSLKENIKYGKEDATDEDMIQAAKSAYAHDFITKLQDGYDTGKSQGAFEIDASLRTLESTI